MNFMEVVVTEQHDWKTPVNFGRAGRLKVTVKDWGCGLYGIRIDSEIIGWRVGVFRDELPALIETLQDVQRHMEEQNE